MQWFLSLSFINQVLFLYIIVINLVTFFGFGLDKLKSQLNHRRVSEKALWFVALIGGTIGALFAMHFFRHKTKKTSFQFILALILAGQILLVFFFLSDPLQLPLIGGE